MGIIPDQAKRTNQSKVATPTQKRGGTQRDIIGFLVGFGLAKDRQGGSRILKIFMVISILLAGLLVLMLMQEDAVDEKYYYDPSLDTGDPSL